MLVGFGCQLDGVGGAYMSGGSSMSGRWWRWGLHVWSVVKVGFGCQVGGGGGAYMSSRWWVPHIRLVGPAWQAWVLGGSRVSGLVPRWVSLVRLWVQHVR